jgi:hypothetical protein
MFFGKYKGFVRDNDDPEKRGRLRCYCPQVMGDKDAEQQWTGWAEANWPWLGGINAEDFGPPFTKEQNDGDEVGVWLEFEAGDADFPIWTGTFTIAPTTADGAMQVTEGKGTVGGGIIQNPALSAGPLTDLAAIDPPKPLLEKETRLRAKAGRDILILVDGGGTLIIGQSGVHLTGVQVTVNGKQFFSSSDKLGG